MIINPYRFGTSPGAGFRSRLQFGGADASTTFTDDTSKTWTAFGNAQIDTSLGDQRGLFDGSGDYITTPNHADLVFGSNNFKISFIHRLASKTGFQTIASKGYVNRTTGTGWIVQTGNGDGRINFYLNGGTGATVILSETSGTINTGQDYLIEIERTGSTAWTLKRDTVTVATNNALNPTFDNPDEASIGGGSSSGYNSFWTNGWLKDFKIT